MKYKTLICAFLLCFSSSSFSNTFWQDVPSRTSLKSTSDFQHRALSVEQSLLKQQLWFAPLESSGQSPVTIDLPLPDGSFINVSVYESPVLSEKIAATHPDIKTFKVYQTDNAALTGRLDFTPRGFHAMLRTTEGIVYINPDANYSARSSSNRYRSFKKNSQKSSHTFICNVKSHHHEIEDFSYLQEVSPRLSAEKRFGSTLRTYRLALAATSEYNTAVGGDNKASTLAEMITAINRVNELYEKEVAIKFNLVSGTELISSNTSDFSNNNGDSMLLQNQAWIDGITGTANYDLGHIFSTGGGGLATMGAVCDGDGPGGDDDYKAQGVTGLADPTGDAFYIDYVAHEIGHQLGATHTFNADGTSSGDCRGNRIGLFYEGKVTFLASSAYEVGSGSTIMGYAGLCDDQNLQENSDPYFHARSIEQIRQLVDGDIAAAEPDMYWADGSICGSTASTGDIAPVVSAGDDYTIPANTPFVLTGDATDADSAESTFTYTWEQYDLGNATRSLAAMHTDQGSGPLIRSLPGTASPERYIPSLNAILSGDLKANIGERLPTTDRTLNFRLTLRSGTNGIDQDDMKITVTKNAGAFNVTAPIATETLEGFSFIETKWDVANTTEAPVNCDLVNISYSIDGGNTFSKTLLSNTANDGSEYILLPNLTTSEGRIKVQCSDNIFFNISPVNLSIAATTVSTDTVLSLSDASGNTQESPDPDNFTFQLARTGTLSGTSSVDYSVSGSGVNPTLESDFPNAVFPSGNVVFSAGETLKTISIMVDATIIDDEEKTFIVTLSNPVGAIINNDSATGTATITLSSISEPNNTGNGKSSSDSGGTTSLWILGLLLVLSQKRKIKHN